MRLVGMEPVGDASSTVLIHNRWRAWAFDGPQKGVIFCAFFEKNKSEPDTHPVRSSPLALADGPYALPPLR